MNDTLWGVMVGWLLGTGTTLLTDWWKERRRRRRLLDGLQVEFGRLEGAMATLFWNFADRSGTATKADVEWVLTRTSRAPDDDGIRRYRESFSKARDFTDEEFQKLRAYSKAQRGGLGIALRTYDLPFLDSHLSDLSVLDDRALAAEIMNVRAQVAMFNGIVADAREFHRMTFDASITGQNHEAVAKNLESAYEALNKRARWTADAVEQCLSRMEA